MHTVGLTGNIGSGKTTIAKIFKTMGIPVYHADMESKKFLNKPEVILQLIESFGTPIIESQKVNKKALANIVFKDKNKLRILNNILHPLVMEDFLDFKKCHYKQPYLIHEAAVIFENNLAGFFDKIIMVYCPEDVIIKRVIRRDQISVQEVRRRLDNQWDQQKKMELSDFIIKNDGSESIISQVLDIDKALKSISTEESNNQENH